MSLIGRKIPSRTERSSTSDVHSKSSTTRQMPLFLTHFQIRGQLSRESDRPTSSDSKGRFEPPRHANNASRQNPGSASQGNQLQQKRSQIKAMTQLLNQFYGDLIRIKVFPFRVSGDKILVGTADRSMFRYPPASLVSVYGSLIDAGWTSILQINKGTKQTSNVVASSTGNPLEDGSSRWQTNLASSAR